MWGKSIAVLTDSVTREAVIEAKLLLQKAGAQVTVVVPDFEDQINLDQYDSLVLLTKASRSWSSNEASVILLKHFLDQKKPVITKITSQWVLIEVDDYNEIVITALIPSNLSASFAPTN